MRSTGRGLPVGTTRLFVLAAFGFVPALLTAQHAIAGVLWGAWLLLLAAAAAFDYRKTPHRSHWEVARALPSVLSSGVPNPVQLTFRLLPRGLSSGSEPGRHLRGRWRDVPPVTTTSDAHHGTFERPASGPAEPTECHYTVVPNVRGTVTFGDLTLRIEGPWGLCSRQLTFPTTVEVPVLPDLTAWSRDALTLARAEDAGQRVAPRRAEGRVFESLREYRTGDSLRDVDWKTSARRSGLFVREYQPEKNQPVLLLLDCGRHMAGVVRERRKLDHAVDAALRVAKVSLSEGDAVGVYAFGSEPLAWLPPRTGSGHLRALTRALAPLEAQLEESDYGRALDHVFRRHHRRSLVVVFTDLRDEASAKTLVTRTMGLVPRHLPLVVSLLDEDVTRAAASDLRDPGDAYVRPVAERLEAETAAVVHRLRRTGTRVVRSSAEGFGASAVRAYLDIKARGLL